MTAHVDYGPHARAVRRIIRQAEAATDAQIERVTVGRDDSAMRAFWALVAVSVPSVRAGHVHNARLDADTAAWCRVGDIDLTAADGTQWWSDFRGGFDGLAVWSRIWRDSVAMAAVGACLSDVLAPHDHATATGLWWEVFGS